MKEQLLVHIQASYDAPVDVLHLVSEAVPYEGDGMPGGIELDYSIEDGRPCGIKVIGFQRNGWDQNTSQLAKIAGQHFRLDVSVIASLISKAFKEKMVS
jgi:hypothetical protein